MIPRTIRDLLMTLLLEEQNIGGELERNKKIGGCVALAMVAPNDRLLASGEFAEYLWIYIEISEH